VPLLDIVLYPDFFDLIGHGFQLPETKLFPGALPQAGQVDCQASEVATHLLHHAVPKLTAGGNAVDEQHRVTRPARK
jgi:hypothetical protein